MRLIFGRRSGPKINLIGPPPFKLYLIKLKKYKLLCTYIYIYRIIHIHTHAHAHSYAHSYTYVHVYIQKYTFSICIKFFISFFLLWPIKRKETKISYPNWYLLENFNDKYECN